MLYSVYRPWGGLVAKVKPSCNRLLIKLVVDLSRGQIRIHRVSLLWLVPDGCGNAVLQAELAQLFFENAAREDSRRILVALIQQVLGHFQKIREQVSLNQLLDPLQMTGSIIGFESPQDAGENGDVGGMIGAQVLETSLRILSICELGGARRSMVAASRVIISLVAALPKSERSSY